MRKRTLRRMILWLAPGGLLWLSCSGGVFKFLAPIVQPIISQVLTDVASALTDSLQGP